MNLTIKLILIVFSLESISANIFSQVPTAGLVGYYPFTGDANDASTTANNGTVHGAILAPDRFGIVNACYRFDGVDDYISINNRSTYDFKSYTISLWFKYLGPSANTSQHWELINKNATKNSLLDPFSIAVFNPAKEPDNILHARAADGTTRVNTDPVRGENYNQWHHVVILFDNNTNLFRLYLDGVRRTSNTAAFDPVVNTSNINIGRWEGYLNYFNGLIDDVRIYNLSLTETQINELYRAELTSPTVGIINDNEVTAPITGNPINTTYEDESSFVASFASYGFKTPNQIDLNRIGTTSGFKEVYGFTIPPDKNPIGFKWNKGDEETYEWRPQGIAGFTTGIGISQRRYLLVSWYAVGPNEKIDTIHNEHKGSRISLVDITDMNNIKYRHILLVQSFTNRSKSDLYKQSTNPYTQLGMFIPVTIHVGGIAYYNGKIYVADTHLGIRVFDINKIVAAENDIPENIIGREKDGKLKAFNYGYILPQTGYYRFNYGAPFSCIETGTGASSNELMLWTGQYYKKDEAIAQSIKPQIIGFRINDQGTIVNNSGRILIPKDEDTAPVYGIQGVYREGTKTFMSITGTTPKIPSSARLVRYDDGSTKGIRYPWPHGAEDLYLESYSNPITKKATKLLWCLTEYETQEYKKDNRCVFAVKLSDYLD